MYTIKVLRDKDFFKLAKSNKRYSNVDNSNLGFADPVNNTAYVRFTAYPRLNKYLIDHEFEHLMEEEGTHEDEYGVRHKKFFQDLFAPVLSSLFGASNLFGSKSSQPQQQTQQSQAQPSSYAPTTGQYYPSIPGAQSGQNVPSYITGSVTGGLSPASLTGGSTGIPDELKQQLSGYYASRSPKISF